jgi:hypothetical protein
LVDLSNLIELNELFILETKNFGSLKICYPAWMDFLKLSSKLNYLKSAPAEEVVRHFISIVAFLPIPDKEGISLDGPKIELDNANKLSQGELSQFSELFLDNGKEFFLQRNIDLKSLEENGPPIEKLKNLLLQAIDKELNIQDEIYRKSGIFHLHESINSKTSKDILRIISKAEELYKGLIPLQRQYDILKGTDNTIKLPFSKYSDKTILPSFNPIEHTNKKLDILIDWQDKNRAIMQDSLELFVKIASDYDRVERRSLRISIAILLLTFFSLVVTIFQINYNLFDKLKKLFFGWP